MRQTAEDDNVDKKRARFKTSSKQTSTASAKAPVSAAEASQAGNGAATASNTANRANTAAARLARRFQTGLQKFWSNRNAWLEQAFPILQWGRNYKREDLSGDIMAGIVVAIMLMPQSMAYAMLAGLPAQIGLYTAVLPLILYAIFGSSRVLGVGPVAIVSLMVATTLESMNLTPEQYLGHAMVLALLSGIMLVAAGIAGLGFITNFISHPVIAGFTTAGALIIAFSQLTHILGVKLEGGHNIFLILKQAIEKAHEINPTTLLLSLLGILLMASRGPFTQKLRELGVSETIAQALPKGMALFLVVGSILFVAGLDVASKAQIEIVGKIPAGLPPIVLPAFDWRVWEQLLPAAALISLVGLVESLSVAKALATRQRQKIYPNQELVGLGMANLGAAITSGYPVTGSFSRSVVNFTSGANTQLAAIITAVLIAIVLMFFTPLLHDLPRAILAVIIIMAVSKLIDFGPFFSSWRYYRPDGLAFLATFFAVLIYGVEIGILSGIVLSVGMYLWRMSRPRMPVLGRVGDSTHFRSAERHDVQTYDRILIIRVDENLVFANAAYLEERMLQEIADHPEVKHLVLVMNAVSLIDASALETLENLVDRYREAGVLIHLAGLKAPVRDMLERSHFLKHLSPGEIFMSPHEAVLELTGGSMQPEGKPVSGSSSAPAIPATEERDDVLQSTNESSPASNVSSPPMAAKTRH